MTNMENAYTNISVWWDIESCPIPTNFDGIDYIAKNICIALSNANFHGKLSISAYGNTDLIPGEVQNALQRTGISFHHVPTGGITYLFMITFNELLYNHNDFLCFKINK